MKINITPRNVTYYKNKGYDCNISDPLDIDIDDLHPASKILEERKCDVCGCTYKKSHCGCLETFNTFNKDVCPWCYKNNSEIKKII